MKRLFNILLIASLYLGATSCSDYLDITPSGQLNDEIIWTTEKEVEKWVAAMYSGIQSPKLYQDDPWVGCSDECDLSWTVYMTYPMNQGNWTESNRYYDMYNTYFGSIRHSLVLEKNIDRCTEMAQQLRTRRKAEAKFVRGYMYWMLLRQYGPQVLVKDVLYFDQDFSTYERSTYDQTVEYICELMDEAAKDLPDHWWGDVANLGRPNKLVCQSVKAIVLHHAASPAFNGNTDYADFVNNDGTHLINQEFQISKWQEAAKAAKKVIDISEANPDVVRLYTNSKTMDDSDFDPYVSHVDKHLKVWNKETIFARSKGHGIRGWIIHASPGPKNLGGVGPTQRLVDAFLMKNGKPIEYSGSGYEEAGFATEGYKYKNPYDPAAVEKKQWNPNDHDITKPGDRVLIINDIRASKSWGHWADDRNMFANREPRFYSSILYNRRIIPQLPINEEQRNQFSSSGQADGYGRAELYYGGASRQTGGSYTFYSRTGYLSFTYCDPMSELGDTRVFPQNYMDVFIRYATILLDYIEAMNESDGSIAEIQKYWDQIRKRAGVPSAFVATPDLVRTKEGRRDMIMRERQIELNMEGDRYFTTRRMWLAHKTDTNSRPGYEKYGDGGPMYGMDINAGDAKRNNFFTEEFYKRTIFETRVFRKEFYFFPLPITEVNNSAVNGIPRIVQNPWWRQN